QAHCSLEQVELQASAQLVVYRMVQEAITNITKYAQARNVWITLAKSEGWVEISVRDDGIGFDPAVQRGSAHGLVGMRFRVEAEGGVLTVESKPGQGSLILARLPKSTPHDSDNPVMPA
ncbi:MAG: histidine kinase, partial [Rhodoferax sp.]|nr:histidine kinase [Rhodoferax sp.]